MNIHGTGWRRVAAALVWPFLAACGGPAEVVSESPVSDSTYVAVMVHLLLLDASPPSAPSREERDAAIDSARAEILATHGVTAGEILAFAGAEGADPGRMQSLWESITHDFDSIRSARLRRDTEARSEAEGKLGADARRAAGEGDPGGATDSAAATPTPQPPVPSRLDSLLRDRQRRATEGPGRTHR